MVDREVGAKLRAELARLTPLNPFEVLGIPTNASAEQVRAAYLTATKAYHPNRYARETAETVESANEVFLVIRRAYSLLWDDAKRKATQQKVTGAGPAPPRIRAGLESAPSPGAAARPPTMPAAPTATRTPATQPPQSGRAQPPTQPPIGAAPSRIPPTQPPRSGHTPPPQLTVPASSRAPATQPPRVPSSSTGSTGTAPRARPPVVPTQTTTAAPTVSKPLSPQTGRSPEQVTAVLEAVQTRGQRFELACRLIQKNRALEARPILNQLVNEDRHHRKYRVKLMHAVALEHRDAGRFEEAIRELERAVAFDPEVPEIRAELERLREQTKGFFSKLFGR